MDNVHIWLVMLKEKLTVSEGGSGVLTPIVPNEPESLIGRQGQYRGWKVQSVNVSEK